MTTSGFFGSLRDQAQAFAEDKLFELVQRAGALAAGLKLKTLELEPGRQMYYYDSDPGSSRPVLVLVHGFNADKSHWTLLATHLRRYRLLIPDLGGHGQTWHDSTLTYDIPYQARLLYRFLQTLGVGACHLAGNSMGGWVSAWFAADYPHMVKTLSLLNAAGVSAPNLSPFFQALDRGRNPFFYDDQAGFDALLQLATETPLPAIKALEHAQFRLGQARQLPGRKIFNDITNSNHTRFAPEQLLEPKLGLIIAPTLLLWGRQDRIIDVTSVGVFAKGLRQHEAVILEGVGHIPMVERPRQTARIIKRFINQRG
jgi:pimeloyl-ACP methyl ester carboxylesterase